MQFASVNLSILSIQVFGNCIYHYSLDFIASQVSNVIHGPFVIIVCFLHVGMGITYMQVCFAQCALIALGIDSMRTSLLFPKYLRIQDLQFFKKNCLLMCCYDLQIYIYICLTFWYKCIVIYYVLLHISFCSECVYLLIFILMGFFYAPEIEGCFCPVCHSVII